MKELPDDGGRPENAQKFLDEVALAGGTGIHALSPNDARAVLTTAQSAPVVKAPADIDDRTIPGGPTGEVRIRIVRPKGDGSTLPALMFFHGGGWVLGDRDTHDRLVREGCATGANAAVVFVDYDRAPEAQYPTAIEQAYAATRYASRSTPVNSMSTRRGSLLSVTASAETWPPSLALLAKERRGPRISFQVMFYPVADAEFRHQIIPRVRERAVAYPRDDAMVLGCLSAGSGAACRTHRIPLAGGACAAQGSCHRHCSLRTRTTSCATKARLLRAKARAGGSFRHRHALPRDDPRFRALE